MAPEDIPKTAIITPFGLYKFRRMPFGLKNSAQAFQRLMDGVMRGLRFVFVYLDDILVASSSIQEHLLHVRQVLQRLTDAGLAINVEKCTFGAESVNFLGHTVSSRGITPKQEKVQVIIDMPRPTTKVEMQRFLGCINFYHRFIPHLAAVLAPLHALCSSVKTANAALTWSPALSSSFQAAKSALASFVLLAHPDASKMLSLTLSLIHI